MRGGARRLPQVTKTARASARRRSAERGKLLCTHAHFRAHAALFFHPSTAHLSPLCRYAAKAGAWLLADPDHQDDLGTATAGPSGLPPPGAAAAALRAALTGTGSSSGGRGNGGALLRALVAVLEAVPGDARSPSSACLPPRPVDVKALRTALGDVEQRLCELGLLADLPPTASADRYNHKQARKRKLF